MPGQFYFCGEEAPFFDALHYFGSRNWHAGDGTPWPEYGETEDAKQRWRNGSFGGPAPHAITIGTELELTGEAPMPAADEPHAWGLPLSCWGSQPPRQYCPSGGDSDNGTALVSRAPGHPGIGGDSDNGLSLTARGRTYIGAGGDSDNGLSLTARGRTYVGDGGDSDDGTAEGDTATHYIGDGGDSDDGTAEAGPPDPPVSPCDAVPNAGSVVFEFTLSGITNDSCSGCAVLNQTWTLTHFADCEWRSEEFEEVCGGIDPSIWVFRRDEFGTWYLEQSSLTSSPWSVSAPAWDGTTPLTVENSDTTGPCAGLPLEIEITPV